jgi:3'-phosphoadenosine 5'-phosphosulfate sulfotransferase (PAPS reductase)/FAD synthetase
MAKLPRIKLKDIWAYMRKTLDWPDAWIVTGEKANDSIVRRGMISKWGAVDEKHKRAHILAHWTDTYVFRYLKTNRVPLNPTYSIFDRSLDCHLNGPTLAAIKEHFPSDFARILHYYPFARIELMSYEQRQDQSAGRCDDDAERNHAGPVQPADMAEAGTDETEEES